jgi:hypothetical protein
MTATSAKEHILDLVEQQPDDSTYDEILRELALARMIDRGLADVEAGRTISHEEIGERIRSWATTFRRRTGAERLPGLREVVEAWSSVEADPDFADDLATVGAAAAPAHGP